MRSVITCFTVHTSAFHYVFRSRHTNISMELTSKPVPTQKVKYISRIRINVPLKSMVTFQNKNTSNSFYSQERYWGWLETGNRKTEIAFGVSLLYILASLRITMIQGQLCGSMVPASEETMYSQGRSNELKSSGSNSDKLKIWVVPLHHIPKI